MKSRTRPKNSLNRKIFIVTLLALPILQWLVFWLYVNINSFILAFQTPKTYEWTFSNFQQFWYELTNVGGTIGLALKNTFLYFVLNMVIMFVYSIRIDNCKKILSDKATARMSAAGVQAIMPASESDFESL